MELLGIALGIGLVLLAPSIPVVRDVAKLAVKSGLAVTDKTKEVVTSTGKHWSDLAAQAETELAGAPGQEDLEVPIEMASTDVPTTTAAVEAATRPEAAAPAVRLDDLTQIKGIGPKMAGLLNEAGIQSLAQLAETELAQLQEIVDQAGSRFRLADPTSWASQAKALIGSAQ